MPQKKKDCIFLWVWHFFSRRVISWLVTSVANITILIHNLASYLYVYRTKLLKLPTLLLTWQFGGIFNLYVKEQGPWKIFSLRKILNYELSSKKKKEKEKYWKMKKALTQLHIRCLVPNVYFSCYLVIWWYQCQHFNW